MTDTESITAALRTVTDPDLGGDVVGSGLLTDVTVEGNAVTLSVELAGLDANDAEVLVEEMRSEVLSLPGVGEVRVDGEKPGASAAESKVGIDADRIVAVASAKGGVGKSTVATALARGLAERGEDVGVFDADIYGPNVPRLLDAEGPVVATTDGRAAPVEAAGIEVMSIGLLENDAPIAWRGAMAHEALLDLLTDTAWDGLDTLVVDLPPGTGDVVLTTLQEVPVDGVVLVTTPYPTAVDDTGRSAALFEENGVPLLGAVVNMDGFTCPSCGDDHDLFDHEAVEDLDVPVLAELPFDASLRDPTGSVPERIVELAERVRRDVADAGLDVPRDALDVRDLPAGIPVELVGEEFAALDAGEKLWIRTDREPDALLSALGGETSGADGPHGHRRCTCDHGHGAPGKPSTDSPSHRPSTDSRSDTQSTDSRSDPHSTDSGSDAGPIETVDVRRTGPDEWVARVEKAAESGHSDPSPAR